MIISFIEKVIRKKTSHNKEQNDNEEEQKQEQETTIIIKKTDIRYTYIWARAAHRLRKMKNNEREGLLQVTYAHLSRNVHSILFPLHLAPSPKIRLWRKHLLDRVIVLMEIDHDWVDWIVWISEENSVCLAANWHFHRDQRWDLHYPTSKRQDQYQNIDHQNCPNPDR